MYNTKAFSLKIAQKKTREKKPLDARGGDVYFAV